MLMPKKTKYRKMFKGRIKGKAQKGNTVVYGDFGLVSEDKAKITSRQIEAARIAINRYLKRGGDVVIRIFPHKPITKRPAEVRMGKGKGQSGYSAAFGTGKPGKVAATQQHGEDDGKTPAGAAGAKSACPDRHGDGAAGTAP